MKKREILIIICIIICCIFSLQAVSAASDGLNTTHGANLNSNVSAYSLPNSNNQLQAGSVNAGTFSNLQNNISGGGSITLVNNYTYDSSSDSGLAGGITITKDTIIDGQGKVIIDANNQARVFKVASGATLTLTGITFINANPSSGHGGSILATGTVHIDNCKFINNTANFANGGAVCLVGLGSTINNSYFEGNKAINNGSDNNGAAGAVFINANNTIIENTIFIKNMAGLNGGAIGSSPNHIEKCTIINCTLTNNTANGSAGGIGMQSSNFHIYNSTFRYNEAKGLFDDITTKPYYPGNGGGMVMRGWDSYAYNCTFIGNIAKQHGGGVYSTNTSYNALNNNTGFELCTFINNTAGSNGGAVDWAAGATHGYIEDSIFINNTAKRSGGAIHWSGHYGSISNSTFTNNNATGEVMTIIGGILGGGDGGAVVWIGSHGIINNSCIFIGNEAKYRGGAIFLHGNATENCTNITVDTCTFEDNIAGTNGGAVDWHEGSHDGEIKYSTFNNNIAKANGGAVYWRGHEGKITYSNFTGNTAKGLLQGLYNNTGDGGAIFWAGVNGSVDHARFINNKAIKNVNNDASGRGGAMYIGSCEHGNRNITITNSYFEDNNAGTNGGAIDWYAGAHDGLVSDSLFVNNIANRSGGAIFWNGHNGTIRNSNFTYNQALGITAAKSVLGPVTFGGDGGAVMWSGALGTVDNCNFINNTAAKRGGAVFLQAAADETCDNTTFKNSYFENNVAGTNGGAIDWNDGAHNGIVENVIFISNTAKRDGGAIFWHGQNGTIKNSKFRNNRATGENWEYNLTIDMGDKIVVDADGNLILGNIVVLQQSSLPIDSSPYLGKLVVLNYTYGNFLHFNSYVALNGTGSPWKELDSIDINVSKSIISPVDWAIDQYFGGDGGTVLWSGNLGLVQNCTFIDSNSARRGGGAYMTGSDYVTYKDCYFENCTSGTNGGGVDWLAGANYGKIINCTFNNTRAARSAGAIYYDGWYGEMTNITIINTKSWGGSLPQSEDGKVKYFGWDSSHWDTNTTGGDAGAIMFTGSNIKVYNVTFIDCVATSRGGAVFLQDNENVTFDLCEFRNNQALGIANNTFNDDKDISSGHNQWLTGYGGAIGFDTGAKLGVIKNSIFINNTARVLGGAISFGKGSSNATISYSIFENNTAKHDGGAISWDGTNGYMDHCTFINNAALIEENVEDTVFNLKSLSQIKNVTTTNAVVDSSAIPVDAESNREYMYIVIKYNETTKKRDSYTMFVAIKNETGKYNWVPLEMTTETGPSTTDWAMDEYFGGDGGTIYWRGDNGVVDNCRFIDSNSARRGGAAYMTGSDNITFQNSYFENCTSGTNGGGLDWLAGANYGKVINCTFNNTRAARSAGAIYYDGDYGYMANITIINATNYGGSLPQSEDGRVKYTGWDSSHWDTNTTGGDGGAIMITGDHVYIYNATFINNTAVGRGGAVFLQDNNNITFDLCTFEDNRALGTANNTYNNARDTSSGLNKWYTGNGGAIGFDKGASNGTILSSKFINNTAARNGGAVSFSFNSTEAYIFNSTFINNTAKRNGGALDWDGTNGNISYCNFTGNSALGTAISTEYANLTSLSNIIAKNGDSVSALGKPSIATDNKLYVLVVSEGGKKIRYELYVSQVADIHYWLKIDETTETSASPVDWAMDEYFGGDGGSIYWAGDNATIDHCKFIDSNSARRGGGAYMTGGDHVSYVNCTFENCTSGTNGGGLDWLAGANYGRVIDCNFTNTQAARSAGAIYYDGDYGEFTNIIIKNTTAHGGDLNESKNGKVKYAGWDSSHWDTNTTGGDGGAIMLTGDNIKLYNVNITDCTAVGRGGAIFVQDNDNVTIDSCKFENNHALGTANNTYNDPYDTSSGINHTLTGHGGAISFDIGASDSSIINSAFINNTAVLDGGAVYFREGATEDKIINSKFEKNHANEDGGALYIDGDDCELHNSTFTSNYAGDDGGAINWKGDVGIIYNITCVNNSGISSHGNSKGGTICLNGNNITLSNSSFTQSYAKVTGGALFVTGNYVNITGSEFKDCNVTDETGGAIQIVGNYVEVRDSTFDECHAPNGGAIYAEGQYVKIIDSNFTDNNVTKDGAALYVNGDYSELHNSTFKYNIAGDDGGAIYWQGSHGTIYNITCENNKGISLGDSNSNGGTICLTGNDVTLSESTFKNSSAGAQGGAIFVTGDNVNILTSEFESCNSTGEGGAIYVLGDYTTISESTFENCNATQGGAIYVEGDGAEISVTINNTRALGADSYIILVDYKFFKDNVKEIKYDIEDTIDYVLDITVDNTFTNETIADLNNTLNDLYKAVDNILNDDGVNNTNITKALDIVSQLKATLTQLNSTLDPGKDKNITLKLISDVENIENELNYVLNVSESLEIPANVTSDIDKMIEVLNEFTPTAEITAENIAALKVTLNKIKVASEGIISNDLFNLTNMALASSLLEEFNQTLHTIDASNVLGLYDDVEKIAKELNSLSVVADSVVIPEVISKGGAIYISGNDALIDGSVINNTEAVYGGGMYIAGHDVKVDNSEFLNLYSSEDGGAIYITGQRGKLYNSKFINNTAGDDGGAINWDGNAGTIYNITCVNNKGISFNGSSSNGGTISLTGNDTSIEKSSFSQTYALISGGAIFVTGNNVNITDSEFKDCNVSMDIADTHKNYANGGGAIYVLGNSSNIVNCTFDNSDAREGGAIYVQGNNVKIDKSNFTESFAVNGGALYVHGKNTTISNSTIEDSIASKSGGAVFVDGIGADIIKSSFNNTHALGSEGNGGGAIFVKGNNAEVIESNFTNTYANSNSHAKGGAMYITGANAEVVDSKFDNAHSNLQGGAIYVNGTDTLIKGSEFYECNVDSEGSEGGAIYIEGENTVIEESSFVDSTSKYRGGAIFINGENTLIEGSSFDDSSAVFRGGAIYIDGANAKVKDSNFTDSSIAGGTYNSTNRPRGGAIYIKADDATVEGSIFINSTVSNTFGDGGAIYIEGDYAKILGSEFEYSRAHTGGAIYLEGDSCNVTESTFTYSHANENGGAMYSTGSSSTVYKSNFTNNLAENSGGAVYWYGGSRSKYNVVDGCIFINNTAHGNTTSTDATRGGGAIYWSENGEYGTVKHSEFYYNSVQSTIDKKVDGGAILWDKSYHALVDNCTFVGNFVTTKGDTSGTQASDVWAQGGAMYLRPYCNYTVQNCWFENCSSSKEAGALYIQSNNPTGTIPPSYDSNANKITLKDSVFINNVAYANGKYNINGGGAIQIKQCTKAEFKNITFINNTANKGGALCVFDGVKNFLVTGANFTGNKANRGSAISASVTFTLKDAVLLDNRADTATFKLTLDRDTNTIDILLEGNDNRLNAMYVKGSSAFSVTCKNVTYWTNNNISTGKTAVTSSSQSSRDIPVPEAGISVTVELFDANNKKLNEGNDIFATDENGKIHLTRDNFRLSSFDNVYVVARLTNEDYYTQVENTTRLPSAMVGTADDVIYHRNATVHVIITPDTRSPEAANGTVSVYYGDAFLGNITVNNNVGVSDAILTNFTADKFLEVGMHNLTLIYWGDLYNDAINITIPITVTKAQSNITFAFGEIGYNLLVDISIVDDWNDMFYADATGYVTVEVYGNQSAPIQTKTVYLVNGTGFAFFDLLPSNYTIKATYNGDDNYNASVNSTVAELHRKHDIRVLIDLNATAGDIMVDDTVCINVKILTPDGYTATGNVTLYLDNEKYILPLNATSQASFNKTGLSAGHKIVTVCYDGSEDLQANYGEASFNVLKYNTTFTINVTNITHNQKEIINITFANETEGVVYIYVNDRNYSAIINNRTAIFELSNLTVGEHNVTVKFPGDWTFNNVTNMTKFYVERITPEIIINVDNVTYGDPTKIIINVPTCVEGDVTIKIDGIPYGNAKPVENGKVEFDLGNLNAGDYTVEAIYGGDTNHTNVTKEQKFKVYKANRTVTIDVQDIVHGAVEHITVHVNATGNVTIRVNGKSETITLDNGVAELDVYNLTAKTYTVDVTYNGNDNYNKSNANETFTVAKMTTSLDVQVHDVLVRGMEYINITVLNSTGQVAKDLNGTVTINIDGVSRTVNVINGMASFNSAEFNSVVGKRVVWVFYEGDVNFTASKAMNAYYVNTRTLEDNEWNVTAKDIYVGETGIITVNLPADVTGFVEIEVKAYDGYRDDTYYKKPENGVAVINPKDLKEGKYHVYVTYIGTDYEESYLDAFFTVSKFPTTIEVSVFSPIIDGDDAIITVTMSPDINGTVELTVEDKIYYVAVVDGIGMYVVSNLANGTYNIKATYAGDYQYLDSTSNTAILEVNMVPTVLYISIDKTSMNISDTAVVGIELQNQLGKVLSINAVVTVKVNGKNNTVGLVNGKGSFTLSGLTNDTYIINAVFAGVDKYMQSISNTLTLEVNRLIPNVNVTATNRSVDETVTITVTIPANATGFVVVSGNFTDNEIYIANSDFANGVATIDVTGLANGTYNVHIIYYGLDNDPYTMGINDTSFTVSKLNATLRIDVNDTVYDNKVNITVYVDNGVEGTIIIKLNNTDLGTFGIVNGCVNITIDNPGVENYTVWATYNGDVKYNVNTTNKTFKVIKVNSVLNILTPESVDAATNATIVVRVNETATGNITITVNGTKYNATINNGVATFVINKLLAGSYDITAEYIGDGNNTAAATVTAQNALLVSKVDCYQINVSANDTKVDLNTTIIVRVPADATGNVSIYVDGEFAGNATVINGVAKLNVTMPYGNHTVNATFSDGKYNNRYAVTNYWVFKHDSPLDIKVDSILAGDIAYINVTAPSDDVRIEIDGKSYNKVNYENGVAYFEVSGLEVGNKTVTAIYGGNSKYVQNTTTNNFTVNKRTSQVNVSAGASVVGGDVVIEVNITSGATGYVIVNVNGTNYTINTTGSTGSVVIKGLGNGTYRVNATYIGDDNYLPSTNNTQTFVVSKVSTPIAINVTNIVYGQNANITVNVTEDASGFITIRILNGTQNIRNITLPIVNGKVNWIVDDLAVENYTVSASYSGDAKYNVNSTNKGFNVTKATPVLVIDNPASVDADTNATIIVRINETATGNITITVNNTKYNATIENGVATFIIDKLLANSYDVTAEYVGDANFTAASEVTKF